MSEPTTKNKKFRIILTPLIYLKWLVIAGFWAVLCLGLYIAYLLQDLPDLSTIEDVKQSNKVVILDYKDSVLATYGDVRGKYIEYHQIPKNLRNAVLATEDKRFFEHFGIDPWGILRAAFANLRAGHTVQGGSTITQQLAKIVFLSSERTLKRKVQEAALAIQIEQKYSKQQILSIYLNRVYLGSGIYGIDAAAKYYFGKNVRDLNLFESAIIAGLLKAPSKYAPTADVEVAGARAYQILLNMLEDGYITQAQLKDAETNPVQLDTSMMGKMRHHYFTDWVYNQVESYVNEEGHDLIVKTTLNLAVQKVAEQVFAEYMDKIHEERKVEQGAVVTMTKDGKILAMVGGRNYAASPFNRATQALRPTGSAFKVFVYVTAMQTERTTEDIVIDEPVNYDGWAPRNFNRNYLGPVLLKDAFAKSLNTVSVKLADEVGIKKVIKTAHALGIQSQLDPNLSLALGTASLTLLEMTSAYATIANDGFASNAHAIEYIRDSHTGEFLYVRPYEQPERILDEATVMKMDQLLAYSVENGTAKGAKNKIVKIRGKTGTSQDFRDAWFLGSTRKYVVGVWLGNDDYSPTKFVSGGTYPVLIGRDILVKLPHKEVVMEEDARQSKTN